MLTGTTMTRLEFIEEKVFQLFHKLCEEMDTVAPDDVRIEFGRNFVDAVDFASFKKFLGAPMFFAETEGPDHKIKIMAKGDGLIYVKSIAISPDHLFLYKRSGKHMNRTGGVLIAEQ